VGAGRVTVLLETEGCKTLAREARGAEPLLRRQEEDTEQDAARASGE
jgi:hypothetical protein